MKLDNDCVFVGDEQDGPAKLKDFEIKESLGEGMYGRTYLVKN
jgi:hypothetical protein